LALTAGESPSWTGRRAGRDANPNSARRRRAVLVGAGIGIAGLALVLATFFAPW
jgi:hypothetical protein